jgi:predicted ribosomally synthesized peptide with nif11-like leader
MTAMETVKKFYEALGKDKQMQERAERLDIGKSPDKETAMAALIKFAAKEGYSFTSEEIAAYFANQPVKEVADAALEGVAGGVTFGSDTPSPVTRCPRCGAVLNPGSISGSFCRCLWLN